MTPYNLGLCLQGKVYGRHSIEPFYIRLDIGSQYTWMHFHDFHVPSNSAKTINPNISLITADNITYIGREIELEFGWVSASHIDILPNFHAYVFTEPLFDITTRTSIGLAAKYTGEQFSFLHQYYNRGIMDELSFSVVGRGNSDGGIVYLGGIPAKATLNRQHTEIKIIGRTHYWDFLLPGVTIERNNVTYVYKSTKDNDYAFLDTVRMYTYAPKEFIDYLVEVVYKEEYEQNICDFQYEQFYNDRQLRCPDRKDIINKLGDITFNIQNYDYKVPMKFFWSCYDNKCVSSIIENHVQGNWRFCMNFIYDSAYFVLPNKTIHLYLENVVTVKYNPSFNTINYSSRLTFIIVIIFASFCGIGMLSKHQFKKVL